LPKAGYAGSSTRSAMPSSVPDRAQLAALIETVAGFHVTDRRLLRAQQTVERELAAGAPSPATVAAYLAAAQAYFAGFAHDAQAQLVSVDRELERLYQRQYNLAAERGVAAKRIEVVQGVLARLAELGPA
jgi:hypothetical protein